MSFAGLAGAIAGVESLGFRWQWTPLNKTISATPSQLELENQRACVVISSVDLKITLGKGETHASDACGGSRRGGWVGG
jgi:hypothetical protein